MTNTVEETLALADAARPIVDKETIKTPFKGDKLDKEKGNWTIWRREIQTFLDMIGLSSHLVDDLSIGIVTGNPGVTPSQPVPQPA